MGIKVNQTNGESKRGFSNIFQIIAGVAGIVSCMAALCVIPQVQQLLPGWLSSTAGTETPVPTVTVAVPIATEYHPEDRAVEDPTLGADDVWTSEAFQIRMRKPTFRPCWNVGLAFEMSFVNTSREPQSANFRGVDLVIADQDGNYYTGVLYTTGGMRTDCIANLRLDTLQIDSLAGEERLDLVFYVLDVPQLETGDSITVTLLSFGNGETVRWQVPVP